MKAPVCGVCLKSGMLCRKCRESHAKGKISDTDIKVSHMILVLSEKFRSLKDITLRKAIDSDGLLVIVCKEGDAANFIGRGGTVVKKLEKETGKRVSVVEEGRNVKEFIRHLIRPVPLIGVNVLYRSGREGLRVLVGKKHLPRMNTRDLSKIVKIMYGKDMEIAGE